jgi:CheY-like chemotaxis protein
VKFTEHGEVCIAVRCAEQAAESAAIEWVVGDTGIGIAPDKLGSLFDAFVQADDSITRRFGGSGLGLAISKQIVAHLGGVIDVVSTPGKGSRFHVKLSFPRAHETAAVPTHPHHAADDLHQRITTLGRPLCMLLAEDNPTNQFVVGRLLRGFAIQLDIANDGAQAVDAAMRTRYDMIFMDMRMPELDGLAATRLIRRRDGPSRDVPIAAMTANAFPEDMEACRAAGMDDFVAKPVNKDQLVEAILRALSRAPGEHAAPAGADPESQGAAAA